LLNRTEATRVCGIPGEGKPQPKNVKKKFNYYVGLSHQKNRTPGGRGAGRQALKKKKEGSQELRKSRKADFLRALLEKKKEITEGARSNENEILIEAAVN